MTIHTKKSLSIGRPREFDIDDAVRKAMNVFWDHGYHDASLQDLLDGMELSKGSFYKAFGDKKGVFLRALDAYINDAVREVSDKLNSNTSPKASISDAFLHYADISTGKSGLRGCFVVLTAVEMLPSDTEVSIRISRLYRRLQALFAATIIKAQDLGEIDSSQDEQTLARFLICHIQGMRVLGKAKTDIVDMRAAASLALKVLS